MPTNRFVENILDEFEDQEWENDTISDFLQEFIESHSTFTAEDFRTFLQQRANRENREAIKFKYCPSCRGQTLTTKGSSVDYSTEDGVSHISLQEYHCKPCKISIWGL